MPLLPFVTLAFFFFLICPERVVGRALGGRGVYIPKTRTLWVSSFSRTSQAGNTLLSVDLSQEFNTLNAPITDHSSDLRNQRCPILHFAAAFPHSNGISVNVFGIGSQPDNTFVPNMVLCTYNTQTSEWAQSTMGNAPLARRNFQADFTSSGQTLFWGGYSDPLTAGAANGSFAWHPDISFFDPVNGWIPSTSPYSGLTRANATMTQISDTNGQLVIVGGVVAPNNSAVDMVTNLGLADMSEIVLYDPRVQSWNKVTTTGVAPPPRKHHTTTLLPDGSLLVVGGEAFNASGAYLLNDIALLNTRDWSWTVPPTNGTALYRSNHTAIVIQNQLWVISGTNATDKAVDMQILDLATWTWTYKASGVGPSGLSAVGGVGGLVGIILAVVAVISAIVAFIMYRKYKRQRRARAEMSLKDHTTTTTNDDDVDYVHAWAKSQQQQKQQLPPLPASPLDSSHHRPSRGSNVALGMNTGSGVQPGHIPGSPNSANGGGYSADGTHYFYPHDETWDAAAGTPPSSGGLGIAEHGYPSYSADPRDSGQNFMLMPFRGPPQKPNLVEDQDNPSSTSRHDSSMPQSSTHNDPSPVTYYF